MRQVETFDRHEWNFGDPPDPAISIEYIFTDGYGHMYVGDSPRAWVAIPPQLAVWHSQTPRWNPADVGVSRKELCCMGWRYKTAENRPCP